MIKIDEIKYFDVRVKIQHSVYKIVDRVIFKKLQIIVFSKSFQIATNVTIFEFRIFIITENNNLHQIYGIVLMIGARGTMNQLLTKLDNNSTAGLFKKQTFLN